MNAKNGRMLTPAEARRAGTLWSADTPRLTQSEIANSMAIRIAPPDLTERSEVTAAKWMKRAEWIREIVEMIKPFSDGTPDYKVMAKAWGISEKASMLVFVTAVQAVDNWVTANRLLLLKDRAADAAQAAFDAGWHCDAFWRLLHSRSAITRYKAVSGKRKAAETQHTRCITTMLAAYGATRGAHRTKATAAIKAGQAVVVTVKGEPVHYSARQCRRLLTEAL